MQLSQHSGVERDAFLEKLVSFQTLRAFLGRSAPSDADTDQLGKRVGSFFAFVWDAADDRILPVNGWGGPRKRLDGPASVYVDPGLKPRQAWYWEANNKLIRELRASGARATYYADLTDARSDLAPASYPVFQKNRKRGSSGAVLWPNHDIGTAKFVGCPFVDTTPFEQKKPAAVWRGGLTGISGAAGQTVRAVEQAASSNDGEKIRELLAANQRSRLALDCLRFDAIDFGITGPQAIVDARPLFGDYAAIVKGHLSQGQQCKFRYLLTVPGADVGTSFFWMVTTNSLVLKVDTEWEVFATDCFAPWVHYVPVEPSADGIAAKIAWCEEHPREVAEMIREAHAVCTLLADRELRKAGMDEVVHRFERHVRG